jgi:transposase
VKPYSLDLRTRVLEDCDAGLPTGSVAAKYRVSSSWVRRLKQRRRETGSIAPVPQRHGPLPTWLPHAEALSQAVREAPDATTEEHRLALDAGLSHSAVWRGMAALGLTLKKSR